MNPSIIHIGGARALNEMFNIAARGFCIPAATHSPFARAQNVDDTNLSVGD